MTNTNVEARNPKQIKMIKQLEISKRTAEVSDISVSNFEHCFELRISNFEFPI